MLWVGGHVGEGLQSCVAFWQSDDEFLYTFRKSAEIIRDEGGAQDHLNGNIIGDFYYLLTFTFDLDLSKRNEVEL